MTAPNQCSLGIARVNHDVDQARYFRRAPHVADLLGRDREALDAQFKEMMKDLERYIQLWNESRNAQGRGCRKWMTSGPPMPLRLSQ